MQILITGGAGFIGSALVRYILNHQQDDVLVIDKLTYAGNLHSLKQFENNAQFNFQKIDICELPSLNKVFDEFKPDVVMHLAAESHVDRSINGPLEFIQTNIIGTYNMLDAARTYYSQLDDVKKITFRFHHISTDEVYGDLHGTDDLFTETTSYMPSSPYSASKASSDHLVRAWHRTFDLPVLITNCSNNYGPFHFPEKLIPLTIINALQGKALPVYGNGMQIRDWLYVDDHAEALYTVVTTGEIGETYNIGGHNEQCNIDVVKSICTLLDALKPDHPKGIKSYHELIKYVKDRPGHDARYAIDASKIANELGWKPKQTFESGLQKTVEWFLNNENWWKTILDGSYRTITLKSKNKAYK